MPFNGVTRVYPNSRQDVHRQAGDVDVISNLLLDIRDGATPAPLGDAVFAVVGDTQTVIHAPGGTLRWELRVEIDAFLIRNGDQNERTVDSITVSGSDITISGHGYDPTHDAEGPIALHSTGDMPAPVVSGELYYVHAIDADTVRLHHSHDEAHDHINPVVFTDAGSGTITLGGAIATAAATDLSGDTAITVTAASSAPPAKEQFEVGGSSASDHTITVKGSTANARLLYWFVG